MTTRKLPAGVQDILPRECRALTNMRETLSRLFFGCGFAPVSSAALEYYDTYSQISNAVAQEKLFKMTDTDGKLLVLRPDVTLAISRIAATKLEDAHARLCYFSEKWDMESAGANKNREIFQAGVECLGEEGAFSDAQTIALAAQSLEAIGLKNFVLDVGHVGYFKGVLEELGLDEEGAERLRGFINAKDSYNAERLLRSAGASGDAVNTVLALPTLFGGSEVLARAKALTRNEEARAAIQHLERVYALLQEMGCAECVCFDLGTVKRLSYYSGIVFTGLVQEVGAAVLSGGRYDNLADDFGKHIPAVGFALGVKRALIALERQGGLAPIPPLDAVIVCEGGAEGAGYRLFQKFVEEGLRVRLASRTGEEGVQAERGCAQKLYYVTKEGVQER